MPDGDAWRPWTRARPYGRSNTKKCQHPLSVVVMRTQIARTFHNQGSTRMLGESMEHAIIEAGLRLNICNCRHQTMPLIDGLKWSIFLQQEAEDLYENKQGLQDWSRTGLAELNTLGLSTSEREANKFMIYCLIILLAHLPSCSWDSVALLSQRSVATQFWEDFLKSCKKRDCRLRPYREKRKKQFPARSTLVKLTEPYRIV